MELIFKEISDKTFSYTKRKSKKNQILLCDSLRPFNYYIESLVNRKNKTPHFVINKRGEIYNLVPTDYYSDSMNKSAIVVILEHLGWLQKSALAPMYVNWIGDVYRGEPHKQKWKDRFFWDIYSSDQIVALRNLIDVLTNEHDIEKEFINHTAEIPAPKKFRGILSKSNYSVHYTDLSPAFNRELLERLLTD